MSTPPPSYTLEFYEDPSGRTPVRDWLDDLPDNKRAAAVAGLRHVLGRLGLEVCQTEYGKQLGKGLAEFRLRHSEDVILGKFAGKGTSRRRGKEKILLRVFFHAHGDNLILLLAAYDKGRYPSPRRQEKEIAAARARLREWRGRSK